jgi:hypothetical protein
MKKVELLQEYLQGLYEAYDAFQADYKTMHKRSKMHNTEPVSEYYLRWRDKMRTEIRRIELVLMKIHTKPDLLVEKNRLQNVA